MDYFKGLPNEVLLEIFDYCKIKPLTLVCRRFNKMIINTSSLMRKLNLEISGRTSAEQLMSSERQYQAVYAKFNYHIREDCLQVLKTFSGIKSLELVRCTIKLDLFAQMLQCLVCLESLTICTTYLNGKENKEKIEHPQLMGLKSFRFKFSDGYFLSLLKNAQLQKLSIEFSNQYPFSYLTTFLRSQISIKTIDYLNIHDVDDSVMTLITGEMRSLHKLFLDHDKLNVDMFRSSHLGNTSVQFLTLYGGPNGSGDISVILNFFKQIKFLKFENSVILESACIARLQQLSPHLESLDISLCGGGYFNCIEIRNLKQLCLSFRSFLESHTVEEWLRLATRNPSIEKLVLKDVSMVDEVFWCICIEFRKLRHLEINYDPPRLSPRILDYICDPFFPKNIRFLKIVQSHLPTERKIALTDEQKSLLSANVGFQLIIS